MSATLFDPRLCTLGEGAFWHPERKQAFWFDILGCKLLSQDGDGQPLEWVFADYVSAAGWLDRDHLLIAGAKALLRLDLRDGSQQRLIALPDLPGTRSNDGRADPHGGFWISTMGMTGALGKGAIFRYFNHELRLLRDKMAIPNAICFSGDGRLAYYADTAAQTVWSQDLDEQGWPCGQPRVFLDLSGTDQFPDGAVTDDQGRFWNARWGSGAVVCHAPDGRELRRISLPATQPSCPAFIGAGLDRLMVTSAAEGLAAEGTQDGATWLIDPGARGRPEPQVRS